jgi:hypothetical protein
MIVLPDVNVRIILVIYSYYKLYISYYDNYYIEYQLFLS